MSSAPLRVLVVAQGADADHMARRVAAAGYAVSVAGGGAAALDVVQQVVPEVVVLGTEDLSFPHGLRALRLDRYPLFVMASAGADALLQVLASCAAGVGGWGPHPNTLHSAAASPIATA